MKNEKKKGAKALVAVALVSTLSTSFPARANPYQTASDYIEAGFTLGILGLFGAGAYGLARAVADGVDSITTTIGAKQEQYEARKAAEAAEQRLRALRALEQIRAIEMPPAAVGPLEMAAGRATTGESRAAANVALQNFELQILDHRGQVLERVPQLNQRSVSARLASELGSHPGTVVTTEVGELAGRKFTRLILRRATGPVATALMLAPALRILTRSRTASATTSARACQFTSLDLAFVDDDYCFANGGVNSGNEGAKILATQAANAGAAPTAGMGGR